MVQITRTDREVFFDILGWHRMWALRRRVVVQRRHIIRAYQDPLILKEPRGLRCPGTYVPGLITAGTYYRKGKCIFWDVCDPEKAIIVDLRAEPFTRLIVEVANPEEAISLLPATH